MKRLGLAVLLAGALVVGLFVGLTLAGPPTTPQVDGTIANDDVDWDVDELVVDDPMDDSAWGASNELDNLYVTWDEDSLFIGISYTIDSSATIVYVDTGVSGGETDFNSARGWTGAYARNITFTADTDIDLMLARWDVDAPQVYTVTDNVGSSDLSSMANVSYTNNMVEYGIPWSLVGRPYSDTICVAALIAGGDNSGAGDSMPDNASTDGDPGPDAITTMYCFDYAPYQGELVINETEADTPSYDDQEFIELYDGGHGNTRLDGLVVVLFNGSDDQSYVPSGLSGGFDLDGYVTDDDGYFVIGSVAGADLYVAPGSSGWLQNGADAVGLFFGDGSDFPNDTPVTNTDLIDAIVYDTDDADDPGLIDVLHPGQPQVNEGGGGDKDNESNQRCPNGSGGQRDTVRYTQSEPTPGSANSCKLVINELDADQTSTDAAEFVELYDGGHGNTALDGLVLVLFNGSGDVSYGAFDLDGLSTDANGYFVLCGDAANVPNCDLDVSPDTNLIQNGADAAALYLGDAGDFPNGTAVTDANLIDAIVYDTDDADDPGLIDVLHPGQPQVNEDGGGDKDNESSQRCPNGSGGQRNTSSYTQASPTSGAENDCPGPVGLCGDPAALISAIQGITETSPMIGATDVIIEGVVVGDFQGTDELDGFFVQEEDEDADGDPASSEGILVLYTGVDVDVGDVVRVLGDVTENYGHTQLSGVGGLITCSTGVTVTAASITFPVSSESYLERFEGMQVTLPQALTVSENYSLGRYGELVLSYGRLMNPTNVVMPGTDANNMQAANDLNRIVLDDGRSDSNPDPCLFPAPELSATNTLRGGDTVTGLSGVLSYDYGAYRVERVVTPTFVTGNPRPSAPVPVSGTVRVASFNVLNYFTTFGSRGADDATEFTRQRTKIITAVVQMDADVIGLIEIENHPTDDALDDLVSGLNDATAPGTYAKVGTGTIGTDAIKVALIYRTAVVTPTGSFAILDSSVDPTFLDAKNRPALAQTFEEQATGQKFTVVVNHLKSKGTPCDDVGDPDTGDGQENCNLTRTSAATALANWLATDPTGSGDPDFLIIGDLNAYAKEDPITALKTAGYVDMVEQFMGPGAYSYVFDGQTGYLDHALANSGMAHQVDGVTLWHINADEPSALDYDMTYKSDRHDVILYSPDAYRSSDHDPVIIDLELGRAYQLYLPLILRSFPNP